MIGESDYAYQSGENDDDVTCRCHSYPGMRMVNGDDGGSHGGYDASYGYHARHHAHHVGGRCYGGPMLSWSWGSCVPT